MFLDGIEGEGGASGLGDAGNDERGADDEVGFVVGGGLVLEEERECGGEDRGCGGWHVGGPRRCRSVGRRVFWVRPREFRGVVDGNVRVGWRTRGRRVGAFRKRGRRLVCVKGLSENCRTPGWGRGASRSSVSRERSGVGAMWLVELALRRPHTFYVLALAILVLGGVSIARTPVDIFPEIRIPVVAVVWTYPGVSPDEMEKRIVTISERAMTTTVNDIEHIESQSLAGASVIRVFFHPGAKIEAAVSQINAINGTIMRVLPPGTPPPFILRFSATNVPVLQLGIGGEGMSEQQIYDNAQNFLRTQMATIQGAQLPLPLGGKPRQIMIDLDPEALAAHRLSASDVVSAVSAQNLLLPTGSAKMGTREYQVKLNSSPEILDELNEIPVKREGGATVRLRDVAQARDGFTVQTNIVNINGSRGGLLTVLKSEGASTLDIVRRVRERLPTILATLPPELRVTPLFDQSPFVRAAIDGVIREGGIAACLTGTMILAFLGSWRSTLIVCLSIPLSILTSISILAALGQTINIMTLGGLALAVGILVDDATVEIENIHRHLGMGKPLRRAILDGAAQIAGPAFVATSAICIVFVPVAFMTGAAASLFKPMALAVVFAMMASYILSRTLVPAMAQAMLGVELDMYRAKSGSGGRAGDFFWRAHRVFDAGFERGRDRYSRALGWCLRHRGTVVAGFAGFCAWTATLVPELGNDFFPEVDGGRFRLHVRAPSGTRLEETERLFSRVEEAIRETIPEEEIETILHNIGFPAVAHGLAYGDTSTIGMSDGEILVSLSEEHGPTRVYVERLREILPDRFPEAMFYFQPADIVGQTLNFGLAAPIDVQIAGNAREANHAIARRIAERARGIPGAVDVRVHQVVDVPTINVDVDRTRADESGLTQADVARSLLISLSSSGLASPNYWLNPQNGVSYVLAAQTPQHRIDSMEALANTPISGRDGSGQLLSNLAEFDRGVSAGVVSHYNVQPVFDVLINVSGRDLGSVARDVEAVVGEIEPPRGTTITVRGQVESMRSSFAGLAGGLLFAGLLVYLLLVVNYQSWLDPFLIMMALPGALAGIVWALYGTGTTLSVPALMGTIMSVGVATANSILLVTFANERRREGLDPVSAAWEAGRTRLRPVLMTALAMILGMLPLSLGWGEGGEANAPLGRAVIGGLTLATAATLFFVPVVYSLLRSRVPKVLDDSDFDIDADLSPSARRGAGRNGER